MLKNPYSTIYCTLVDRILLFDYIDNCILADVCSTMLISTLDSIYKILFLAFVYVLLFCPNYFVYMNLVYTWLCWRILNYWSCAAGNIVHFFICKGLWY